MEHGVCHFTLLFQPPFWVGLAERWEKEGYQVCRTVFGAEPTEAQMYQWLLSGWDAQVFTDSVEDCGPRPVGGNPKRARREAARTVRKRGPGTKAQQALAAQREENASARRDRRRTARQEQEERRFQLRQQKKREKRRGR